VSILFAAMHPQGWAGVPVLASIAIVLAAIREWRGTILASATAHALNNGFAMTMLVLAAW
jgi:membrane protease YdiL (CAAX protease family)